MIYLVAILALFVSYYICFSYTHLFNYWKTRGVHGPTPWPLLGNYGAVLFRIKTESQVLQQLYSDYPQEKIIGFFIGSQPALLLRDPKLVHQILNKDHAMFSDRYNINTLQDIKFRRSLFLVPTSENWKPIRSTIVNLLCQNKITKFVPKIETAINEYLDDMDNVIDTNPVQNLYHFQKKLLLSVVSKAIMGMNLKEEFITKSSRIEYLFGWEFFRVSDIIFPQVTKFLQPICVFFGNIFKSYFTDLSSLALKCSQYPSLRSLATFTDYFLQENENKSRLDDETLAVNHATVSIAALEGSATILTCLSFELALNSNIQKKVYEETYHLFQNSDKHISHETLSKMTYLDMVLKETLRMNQISLTLDRVCDAKCRFLDTDFLIDRGVQVYISIEALHRDAKYFPDPERFSPERFFAENRDKIPPGVYMPFAEGPRRCVGSSLTKLIIMMSMSALLQKFKLEPSERTPKKIKFIRACRTRRIENELWVKFSRR